jgi:uncharacterized protein involved in outer membrane biogenesis
MKKKIKRLTLVVIVVILVSSGIIGLFALASMAAKDMIEDKKDGIMGLSIELDRYEIDWFSMSLALKGIKIYPVGQKSKSSLLASADKLALRFSLLDLLFKRLHIHKLTLVEPTISYVQTSHGHSNWDTLDWGNDDKKQSGNNRGGFKIIIDDVLIDDGIINYSNLSAGHRFKLTDLDVSATNIVSDADPDDLPTKISIDGDIGDTDGDIEGKGRANFFAKGINFKFKGSISDAPITYFRSFYSRSVPFDIQSGTLDIDTVATSKNSEFHSNNHAKIYGLKAGGIDGVLINKLVLQRAGTIRAEIAVNGNLDSGNFYVSSALSKGLADSILSDAKKLDLATIPGEAIKGVGKSIKKAGTGISKDIKKLEK